ncbi:hypothetical protein KOR42_33160 [Thalassoglobus neptunius]|uniref:Uncharacterized protein n=1 Tax=Thalassoglobus neptunius TaxID=1938619 RepID=A0A5C5WPB4_9PLAN|nr:hypothetical protein [Thalassoglobus neptunius]TWT51843.1 hypothetical protein KOR42_33160 [Thalassoglobus neptunius]
MPALPRVLSFDRDTEQDGEVANTSRRTEYYYATVTDLSGAEDALYQYNPRLQYARAHPVNSSLRVERFSTRLVSKGQDHLDGWHFSVGVTYSSLVIEPIENPLSVPASVELSSVDEEKTFERDYLGKPIATKAGQLIQGVTDQVPLTIFSVTKNIPIQFRNWMLTYGRAINQEPVNFSGEPLAPKTLQLARLNVSGIQYLNRIAYRVATLEIAHNPDTWVKKLLNRGTVEINLVKETNSRGRTTWVKRPGPIRDHLGGIVETPMFLDEDGQAIRVDSLGRNVSLARRLNALRSHGSIDAQLKQQLQPRDILTLEFTTKTPRKYLGVLPLS